MYEMKTSRKIWIVLACIALNLIGKAFADYLHLPVWLDMVGTCIASCMVGTIGGVIAGIFNNLLYGLLNHASYVFAITSAATACAVGYGAKKGYFKTLSTAMMASFWIGIICMCISTPLNLLTQNGYSGNIWGDALFDMLDWNGAPKIVCAVCGEAIVEIVDKQITILIAFGLMKLISRIGTKKEKGKAEQAASVLLILCFALSLLAPDLAAYAKQEDGVSDNFIPQIYNNTTGMMSSEANVIEETNDGYIWIGSYAGLTRYDGKSFEFIRYGGITSVTCLYTDSKGRLWIGTNDRGIACYENGVFSFYTKENGLPADSIREICENDEGMIYVATTDRICRLDGENTISVVEQNLTYVISMESYKDCIVGVANNGQLFVLDKNDQLLTVDASLSEEFFNCVELTSYGLMAGSSGNTLYQLEIEGNTLKAAGKKTSTVEDIIDVTEDKEGRIWLCVETGLGFFDKNGIFKEFHYANFDSSFEDIHEDYQGNIWVASSRYGVMKLAQSSFVDLFQKGNVPSAVVNAVVPYKSCYYCGTDNGLYILRKSDCQMENNALTELLQSDRIRCLFVDSADRLWVCTYSEHGLICYDGTGEIVSYTAATKGLTSDRVRCITEMADGTLAVGTSDGLNFIRDGEVVGTITAEDGLANTQILSLLSGEDGTLYVGTDGGGLYTVTGRKLQDCYSTKNGLSSDVILRIVAYNGGYFLVTSNSLCYMKGTVKILDDFPYFNNYDIVIHEDNAYVLSSAGVYVADVRELAKGKPQVYELYSVSDGLLSALTANAWNYLDDKAVLYMCCNSGVVSFYTNAQQAETDYAFGIPPLSVTERVFRLRTM